MFAYEQVLEYIHVCAYACVHTCVCLCLCISVCLYICQLQMYLRWWTARFHNDTVPISDPIVLKRRIQVGQGFGWVAFPVGLPHKPLGPCNHHKYLAADPHSFFNWSHTYGYSVSLLTHSFTLFTYTLTNSTQDAIPTHTGTLSMHRVKISTHCNILSSQIFKLLRTEKHFNMQF